MTNVYKKAYTEVIEILNHFSKEEYSKIPTEKIEYYKTNMDKDYIFKINPEIDLAKQNISHEANSILISLFRDYFATESQKEVLNNLLNQNQEKAEEIKKEKYNPDNIFKKENEFIRNKDEEKTELIKYKETFFNRFIRFIKSLLKG